MAFAAMATTLKVSGISTTGLIQGISTEAIDAGHSVRLVSGSNRYEIANSDATGTADMAGVALNSTLGADQPVFIAPPGFTLTTLSGLVAGTAYFLGGAADQGDIGLFADLATPNYFTTIVGIALTTTTFYIIGYATGAVQ